MSVGDATCSMPAAVHHRDAVGHRQRFLLVVGDQDGGDAGLALEALDLDLHVEPQVLVERGERLVEQQHLGIDREAARERDALLLAAGELARHALARTRVICTSAEHLGDARRDLVARPAARLQAIGDVLGARVMCGNSA